MPPPSWDGGTTCPSAGRASGTVGWGGEASSSSLPELTRLGCLSWEEEGRGFARGLGLASQGRQRRAEHQGGWVRLALVAAGIGISF